MNKKFIHTFCRRCKFSGRSLMDDSATCLGPSSGEWEKIGKMQSCPRGLEVLYLLYHNECRTHKPRAPRKPMTPETERILHDCLAGIVAGLIAAGLIILFLYTINSK